MGSEQAVHDEAPMFKHAMAEVEYQVPSVETHMPYSAAPLRATTLMAIEAAAKSPLLMGAAADSVAMASRDISLLDNMLSDVVR